MTSRSTNSDVKKDLRLPALRRFATAITALTILGHFVLGFEQSYAYVLVALATGYSLDLVLELIDAWSNSRKPRFYGNFFCLVNYLLPAHITSLAIAMLLYSNERLWPIAFAVAVAVGSKHLFRVNTSKGPRHFLNPSNAGISLTLVLFPWIGIAPPYQFTENTSGAVDWIIPSLLILAGTFLNAKFTKRMPLITAWLVGFVAQAIIRNWYFDTPIIAALDPVTGVAFLLFTFYMVTDPGTTPFDKRGQIYFGSAVALIYGVLMMMHVVFGLFFALTIVCFCRGLCMSLANRVPNRGSVILSPPKKVG